MELGPQVFEVNVRLVELNFFPTNGCELWEIS